MEIFFWHRNKHFEPWFLVLGSTIWPGCSSWRCEKTQRWPFLFLNMPCVSQGQSCRKVSNNRKITPYERKIEEEKGASPEFFFSHCHEEQPCQILFRNSLKVMVQSCFETKMFRLSLEQARTYVCHDVPVSSLVLWRRNYCYFVALSQKQLGTRVSDQE